MEYMRRSIFTKEGKGGRSEVALKHAEAETTSPLSMGLKEYGASERTDVIFLKDTHCV
jgi:hypothetical protein